MSNYTESKKVLDQVAKKYGCKGDIIMRTATQYIIEYGQYMFKDEEFIKDQLQQIEDKHRIAEAEGKHLWMTKDFELTIFNCARELAEINSYDLIIYMQKEMYWSNEGGLDYGRAIELLKSSLEYLENYNNCNNTENYEAFQDIGLEDDEIDYLGFDYLISEEE